MDFWIALFSSRIIHIARSSIARNGVILNSRFYNRPLGSIRSDAPLDAHEPPDSNEYISYMDHSKYYYRHYVYKYTSVLSGYMQQLWH